jgi:hypothetical protein
MKERVRTSAVGEAREHLIRFQPSSGSVVTEAFFLKDTKIWQARVLLSFIGIQDTREIALARVLP